MTNDGQDVYATFDAGATGQGGVAVVRVSTRQVVDLWAYPGTGRPHGESGSPGRSCGEG